MTTSECLHICRSLLYPKCLMKEFGNLEVFDASNSLRSSNLHYADVFSEVRKLQLEIFGHKSCEKGRGGFRNDQQNLSSLDNDIDKILNSIYTIFRLLRNKKTHCNRNPLLKQDTPEQFNAITYETLKCLKVIRACKIDRKNKYIQLVLNGIYRNIYSKLSLASFEEIHEFILNPFNIESTYIKGCYKITKIDMSDCVNLQFTEHRFVCLHGSSCPSLNARDQPMKNCIEDCLIDFFYKENEIFIITKSHQEKYLIPRRHLQNIIDSTLQEGIEESLNEWLLKKGAPWNDFFFQ